MKEIFMHRKQPQAGFQYLGVKTSAEHISITSFLSLRKKKSDMEFRLSAAEVRDENRRRVAAAGMLHTNSWQMSRRFLALLSWELIRDQLVRCEMKN